MAGIGRSDTFNRQRKRFQLELEIGSGAIQLRWPLRPSQKLAAHRDQSGLVGNLAPRPPGARPVW